jgi:hypothetical protein
MAGGARYAGQPTTTGIAEPQMIGAAAEYRRWARALHCDVEIGKASPLSATERDGGGRVLPCVPYIRITHSMWRHVSNARARSQNSECAFDFGGAPYVVTLTSERRPA